jgi:hypothetical protein
MELVPPPGENAVETNTPRAAQVLRFDGITKLDIPVEHVLDGAAEADLKCIVVLGYDTEGNEFFSSSMADGADVLWLLERLKRQLLASVD